jgi:hypothetical protein
VMVVGWLIDLGWVRLGICLLWCSNDWVGYGCDV